MSPKAVSGSTGLHAFLTRWIWLCICPLALLAVLLAFRDVRDVQAQRDARARRLAESAATSVDRDLNARINALRMLGESPLIDDPSRWADLYREAQGFRQSFGSHVILADLGMRMLFNTRVPYGQPLPVLPRPAGRAAAPLAVQSGKPAVGDTFIGPVANAPLVAIAVPVLRDGKVAKLLLTTFETRQFLRDLNESDLPGEWSLALLDSRGAVIAQRLPAQALANDRVDANGRFVSAMSAGPWSVVLEIPRRSYRAPLVEAAVVLGVGLVIATLAGALGGMVASRKLSRWVAMLAQPPGSGQPLPPIAEIALARHALDEAAQRRAAAEQTLRESEQRLRSKVDRLSLLDRITSAIGERQDLHSIFQVVVRSLEEQMPVDHACVMRIDPPADRAVVVCTGAARGALALGESMPVEPACSALWRCIDGPPIYEAAVAPSDSSLSGALARAGFASVVAASLASQGQVFGMLLVARRTPDAFAAGECEFLRQLSSHIGLATQQAQLYASLKLAYDELRQTQQLVTQQERLRALGQMASGIAHDINNAISPAALYIESILERDATLGATTRNQLQVVARAIDDVAATVARMREFSRCREAVFAPAPVQLNEVVRQVVDHTKARWHDMPQRQGVFLQLRTDLCDGLPEVSGSETEIREALVNLVFNAVDAMPRGGELTLRTYRSTSSAGVCTSCVEVVDTGIGMDERTRQRCLEPFFTTKGERGTGLGLAMVYGAMQRHGADVDIRSEPGRGTAVALHFPCAPAAAAQQGAASSAPSRPCRILLIDDDPFILETLKAMLAYDGHKLVTLDDGRRAVDALHEAAAQGSAFDLVITDLGMPHVDGREVAAAIKRIVPTLPVILLTGWGEQPSGEDAQLPSNVDLVLAKPPKLVILRQAIARAASRTLAAPPG